MHQNAFRWCDKFHRRIRLDDGVKSSKNSVKKMPDATTDRARSYSLVLIMNFHSKQMRSIGRLRSSCIPVPLARRQRRMPFWLRVWNWICLPFDWIEKWLFFFVLVAVRLRASYWKSIFVVRLLFRDLSRLRSLHIVFVAIHFAVNCRFALCFCVHESISSVSEWTKCARIRVRSFHSTLVTFVTVFHLLLLLLPSLPLACHRLVVENFEFIIVFFVFIIFLVRSLVFRFVLLLLFDFDRCN